MYREREIYLKKVPPKDLLVNHSMVLGKGGFGLVKLGFLHCTQVAPSLLFVVVLLVSVETVSSSSSSSSSSSFIIISGINMFIITIICQAGQPALHPGRYQTPSRQPAYQGDAEVIITYKL